MNPQEKLSRDVKKFLEVYKVLLPEGKAQFEAQIAGQMKDKGEKTKKLYQALVQSAKDGRDIDETIQAMKNSQT